MRNSRSVKLLGLIITIALVLEMPGIGLLRQEGLGTVDVAAASSSNDWLHTNGGKIVDFQGNEVRLTGVNWFGYATGTNVFDGCWQVSMDNTLKAVADHGFNLIRLPISSELILNWKKGVYPSANINLSTNSNLAGMNSLQILDHAVAKCKEYGIKIMFDIHCLNSDPNGHNYEYWYNGSYSEDKWIESLQWIATHYKSDDTVIAIDLKNEPHGGAKWDNSSDQNNWKRAAQRAGNAVLNINPNLLIVIEGIEVYNNNYSFWGANLRGVKNYPIDFGSSDRNDQIVYSPHDYGPAVYMQPWFHNGNFTLDSLYNDYLHDTWLYIKEDGIAPILIGEWGGLLDGGNNEKWMRIEAELINKYGLSYTFWCLNPNSGDTGGLLKNDWTTWDQAKYNIVKPTLWTNGNGKFIGLDHEIQLGTNGVNLNGTNTTGANTTGSANSTPTPFPQGYSNSTLFGVAHIQNVGDQNATFDGTTLKLGTRGRSLRMESIQVGFNNNTGYSGNMQYRVHIQNIGWTNWMNAGEFAGTRGRSLRLEGIEIRLTGDLAKHYSVEYCAHIQDYGDGQGWVRDGALAGTTGESKRVEEIRIRVVKQNPSQTPNVGYRVHRQDYGWETVWVPGGRTSGTTGQSKRLEAIELNLSGNTAPYSGGIQYCTHVQNIGWQDWKSDGELSGTQGQSLRLEAIKIRLTGEMANHYDVYYRVHAQNYGWLGWTCNGEMSGTSGLSLRLEAIQIVLVPKGGQAPTSYDGVPNSSLSSFVKG